MINQMIVLWSMAISANAKMGRIIPQSCNDFRIEHQNCIKQVMVRDRIYVNVDSINACFQNSECHRADEQNIVLDRQDYPVMRYKMCIHNNYKRQLTDCIKNNLTFGIHISSDEFSHPTPGGSPVVNRVKRQLRKPPDDVDLFQPPEYREKYHAFVVDRAEDKRFKESFANKQRRSVTIVDLILADAQFCKVKQCVSERIPAKLLNDTTLAHKSMCKARRACRKQNSEARCLSESIKLRQTICHCHRQVDKEEINEFCQLQTQFILLPSAKLFTSNSKPSITDEIECSLIGFDETVEAPETDPECENYTMDDYRSI